MIPIISVIQPSVNVDSHVYEFATKNDIPASHVLLILPEKDELTVEQIHALQGDIRVSFSRRILVVLRGVDDSSSEVQNSLLKCLEEEADRIQFLLLVKSTSRLLTTILSRCKVDDKIHLPQGNHPSIDYSELFSFTNNTEAKKEDALERIDRYLQQPSIKSARILRHILNMRKLIQDNNMNPVLALDNILLFLAKTSTIKVIDEK